jgi:hypothetical protein
MMHGVRQRSELDCCSNMRGNDLPYVSLVTEPPFAQHGIPQGSHPTNNSGKHERFLEFRQ